MSVTYTAVLPVREHTVDVLAGLLTTERARRGTRAGTRSLPCRDQAILVRRWFLDSTPMRQLARDNQISLSTVVAVDDAAGCSAVAPVRGPRVNSKLIYWDRAAHRSLAMR
ncbi:hypothetical protein Acsp01_82190 [Actinoplanes sp. NBRC 101535]|nr:hypothetical protein Acsp01_82190 [Actinoplanes sp. NBRC 101535]